MYAGTLLDIAMTHADNIIEQARAGDQQACGKLVKLWYKRIYNYALKYLGDHHLAMEVTQKTFINMFRKISRLEEVNSFRPWLYRIASNCCHEEYRRNNRHISLFVNDDEEEIRNGSPLEVVAEVPEVEKVMQRNDLSHVLEWALQQLGADQREVIIMKEYEGLKFREIAEVLKVSENTVKSRLYYALANLKKLLDQKNYSKENLYYEG